MKRGYDDNHDRQDICEKFWQKEFRGRVGN